jgi:rhomboid protease GluP
MPVLFAATVLAFVAVVASGGSIMSPAPDLLQRWGATYGPLVAAGEWWRLGTAMFLHGGLIHLAFNMFVLLSIGALVERMFGHVPFLLVHLASGVAGSVASVYAHPLSVGIGASGAIFGLYGALFGYLVWKRASMPPDVLDSLRRGGVAFVLYNGVFGFVSDEVDMAAHIGGLVAGVIAGLALASPVASGSARARAAKSLVVASAAAAILIPAAMRLPALDDWPAAWRTLATLETHNAEALNGGLQRVGDGSMTSADFATLIENDVLTPWRRHRGRMAEMTHLPPREARFAAATVTYMDRRISAWQLQAKAFRTEDMALMEQSSREHAAANQLAEGVLQSIGVKPERVPASRRPAAPQVDDVAARELRRGFQAVERLDQASTTLYNTSLSKARDGAMTEAQLARLIEGQILEPWAAQAERIAALRVGGPVEGSRMRLEQYMKLRSEAWRLTARGLRANAPALIKEANSKHLQAAVLLSSMTDVDAASTP